MKTLDHHMGSEDLKGLCTAKAKTTGKRCTRPAIPGGTVCRYHGGAAPQVKAAAEMRLAALVDPAIGRLQKLLKAKSEMVALLASKDVLDRNGFKPTDKVQVEVSAGIIETLQRRWPAPETTAQF